MIFKNKKNNYSGFSLLELILAIAIFSLSSYAMGVLLIDANLSTKLGTERIEALFYAREGLEATRSIRDNNWDDLIDGTHALDYSSNEWVFSSSTDLLIDNKYNRTVDISTESTSTKNISVVIEWAMTPSRNTNVTLNTLLTDWR